MQAQRAGEIAAAPSRIHASDQRSQGEALLARICFQHRPEFGFERHAGAMTRQRERSLLEANGVGGGLIQRFLTGAC